MKKLLTLILLFPLFMSCSSDDDNAPNKPTSQELEKKLVGQWSDYYSARISGTLYRFYENNTFQQYDVLRYDLTPKTIKKNTSSWSSGKYWIEGDYLYLDGSGTIFSFEGDSIVNFGWRLKRDSHDKYEEVE